MNKLMYKLKFFIGILSGRYALTGPIWVQLDLTNICNNNCIGCWCNSPLLKEARMPVNVRRQMLSFNVVKRLIDDLKTMGTERIFLCGGGEPTMHPHIEKIIEYIKKKGLVCALNTNFTLINEEKIKHFIDLGLDEITISLWAATPETYVKTHPNKNKRTFNRIKRVLKFMQEYKRKTGRKNPIVKIYNVIFNMNYKEVKKMVEFAMDVRAEMVEFAPLDPIPNKTEFLLLNEEQRKELLKDVRDIINNKKIEKYEGLYPVIETFYERISNENAVKGVYDSKPVNEIPCYVGWVFSRIMANGDVIPCLKAHKMPMGNLYTGSFRRIWFSKKYNLFRKMAVNFKKTNPYFKKIGNNPNVGCFSSCDNRADNIYINSFRIVRNTRGIIFKFINRHN